ncbi:hypothetical protein L1987_30507 [Smallanthus sonchifolius]|uniref:Uncharacterized protein n=1 Tax=Smallanthus sonchifolius TaxID=185202 RepID=A0ACB9I4F5_9ASTR|nr:hypothetical protein L1987_30507 [Smallanthus sonchifolius]
MGGGGSSRRLPRLPILAEAADRQGSRFADGLDYVLMGIGTIDFYKLMDEVENEDLVFTLETTVDKFGEEMEPYALGLCQSLLVFLSFINQCDEEADDPGALAASGCLRAISTILESVSRLPHIFAHIEPTLLPIMGRMVTTDGQGDSRWWWETVVEAAAKKETDSVVVGDGGGGGGSGVGWMGASGGKMVGTIEMVVPLRRLGFDLGFLPLKDVTVCE